MIYLSKECRMLSVLLIVNEPQSFRNNISVDFVIRILTSGGSRDNFHESSTNLFFRRTIICFMNTI